MTEQLPFFCCFIFLVHLQRSSSNQTQHNWGSALPHHHRPRRQHLHHHHYRTYSVICARAARKAGEWLLMKPPLKTLLRFESWSIFFALHFYQKWKCETVVFFKTPLKKSSQVKLSLRMTEINPVDHREEEKHLETYWSWVVIYGCESLNSEMFPTCLYLQSSINNREESEDQPVSALKYTHIHNIHFLSYILWRLRIERGLYFPFLSFSQGCRWKITNIFQFWAEDTLGR